MILSEGDQDALRRVRFRMGCVKTSASCIFNPLLRFGSSGFVYVKGQ
jgi:hypothetical protein